MKVSSVKLKVSSAMTWVVAALMIAIAVLALSVTWPSATPVADAQPAAGCTTTCGDVWVIGSCHQVGGRDVCGNLCYWTDAGETYECSYECWYEGPHEECSDAHTEWQCSETCTSDCPTTGYGGGGTRSCSVALVCNSSCGTCYCPDAVRNCNNDADCDGGTECPFSTSGGSYLQCQAGLCASVCLGGGGTGGSGGTGSNPTPTPRPFPTPRPVIVPPCSADPSIYGGTVTSVTAPPAPGVAMTTAPNNPVVIGQDPAKRGLDLTTQVTVGACTVNWHYRVDEEYIFCGKATCNCSVDNCEMRTRIKEWDEQCAEPYSLADVTIDGKLSADSEAWINGDLQQQYPGVRVYQGAIRFYPNALARQTQYSVGSPTIWAMQGLRYPMADPGQWDVTLNVTTQATGHCGPLSWTLPFPKFFKVFFRDQTLIR